MTDAGRARRLRGALRGALSRRLLWLLLASGPWIMCCESAEFDPYKVLGVSRRASQPEIKRAYKSLAKEWHPDKNKDPSAEDMFIKISKSYEILSNEERRANFDRYGQMDENQPFGQSQHQGFRSFQHSFYFDESFFQFPRSREFADSKYLLHHAQFNSEVLPDSFRRPYLIKVTSEWCFACVHIEPVWKETVEELEPLGVGIGIIDLGYERRLSTQLGAHRAPSIIGLVNGRVSFFHQAVVRDHLRQFIEDLLPNKLIQKISDSNYESFLDAWQEENKPSVLLFDQVPVVPLLYKLTAFSFRDYVRFGYVDQGGTQNARLLRQFNVNTYAPTMLLFKEDTVNPVDIIQARGMKKQIMDEFVSNNKFLQVPRLVNQRLFDELCPIKQFHRRRKFCVLLITDQDQAFDTGNKAFLDFAVANKKEVLRFAYVYQRHQQPLCLALLRNQAALSPQVVILERRTQAGKVVFRSLSGGWNGSEEDKYRLHSEIELLQKDPSYLSADATLPQLNNEMAPIFFIRWLNAAHDYFIQVYDDLLFSNWREMMPILSLIFSALFILFGTVIIQAFSEPGENKPQKAKAKEQPPPPEETAERGGTSSRPPKKDFVEVTELTDITYTSNLVRLRPGHINVVLVLSDASKNVLLRKFAKEVFSFSGTQTLHFSFLNSDKHRRWMPSLLRSARSDEPEQDEDLSDFSGHVLALNGHRRYFCLFRPVFTGDESTDASLYDADAGDAYSRKSRSRSRSRSSSKSRSRSHSREDRPVKRVSSRATSIELHHKLDRLGLWMERLMEGTLPRINVPAWPLLDENANSSANQS
ncbi:dnaJ homolog subfamily C member 16 isoform X2 [Eucyclogobius newberryi]|uniref:dnaJ homolog subfamily C member 16 isoform X2 n=1 Tax=Eucyclogobius newberryi TaxID=166745 RepID=UPI003B5CABE4